MPSNTLIRGSLFVVFVSSMVILFQNCSSGLAGAPADAGSTQLSSSSNPAPSPAPGPGPGPNPTAQARIPTAAILEISPRPGPTAAALCEPRGLFTILVNGSANGHCQRYFNGETNPTVLEDIAAPVAGACPAGYALRSVVNFGISGDLNACLKFSPANQALGFVSHLRLNRADQPNSTPCRAFESSVTLPFLTSQFQMCFLRYDNLGRPSHAISSLYTTPALGAGCTAGDVELARFSGANSSNRLCAGFSAAAANAVLLDSIATPGDGQACPAGFVRAGDLFVNLHPERYTICAKFALGSSIARPIVGLIRSYNLISNFTVAQKAPCRGGQTQQGEMQVFGGTDPRGNYMGLANVCLDH